jgi:rhodanese-related sulfurtransferase
MNPLAQLALISAVSLAAAGATYLTVGPPQRTVPCDPAALKPDEICIDSVPTGDGVLWVDARSRGDWKKNGLPGSILWNLDPAEDMRVFEADAAPQLLGSHTVVVYCSDENCGVSRQVAERIKALDLGPKVLVLHGGWRALEPRAAQLRGSSPEP